MSVRTENPQSETPEKPASFLRKKEIERRKSAIYIVSRSISERRESDGKYIVGSDFSSHFCSARDNHCGEEQFEKKRKEVLFITKMREDENHG